MQQKRNHQRHFTLSITWQISYNRLAPKKGPNYHKKITAIKEYVAAVAISVPDFNVYVTRPRTTPRILHENPSGHA